MLKVIRYFFVSVLLLQSGSSFSQEIYSTELGVHGGGSYFIGDVISKPMDFQMDYGLMFRYVFNQRLSVQSDFNHSKIAGDYVQSLNMLYDPNITLNQNINTLDFTLAFNFFDYGQLDYILKSSDYSPYLFAGIGMIHTDNPNFNQLSFTIPFGIGFKIKLSERLHFNTQWTHRLMLTDRLEGVNYLNNPLSLNGTNLYNNDHFGTVTIGLSYGLFRRKCKCQNYK